MAGHSKWANIKHRKARQDKVRGKMWSKCSRAIIVAARQGGGDPDMNVTLRYAIDDAKAVNMPKDTIEKAIKKGTGELDGGVEYTPMRFEGYGPGGVAIIVDCLTDNVNRTAPEIRMVFDKYHGKLGVSGSVAFGFTQRGCLLVPREGVSEEAIFEKAIDAGAEDVQRSDEMWEVYTAPGDLHAVKSALEAADFAIESAEVTMIPGATVECSGDAAERVMKLIDAIEDLDDVQKLYTNAQIADADLTRLQGA